MSVDPLHTLREEDPELLLTHHHRPTKANRHPPRTGSAVQVSGWPLGVITNIRIWYDIYYVGIWLCCGQASCEGVAEWDLAWRWPGLGF